VPAPARTPPERIEALYTALAVPARPDIARRFSEPGARGGQQDRHAGRGVSAEHIRAD
jgi:hypothetical protein